MPDIIFQNREEKKMSTDYLEQLRDAVIKMNVDDAEAVTEKALADGFEAMALLKQALIPAMETVGELFGDGSYFLPEMLCSVDAYSKCFALIEPQLKQGEFEPRGKVMIGTVENDIHDIGKNIVAAVLQGNGYEVIDLGTNVTPETFVQKAKEHAPDVIGLSALLSTTMSEMKNVIDFFIESGIRDQFRIIVGGAPVTQQFADEIGADGYGDEAQTGVALVRQFTAQ
jgi:5-methyltetrahydrofolate--homocysteine methyltransferase